MFVKRYIAKDMQEAIRKISNELGPDAVILHNKSVRQKGIKGLFGKKMVEVVAAYEPAHKKKTNKAAEKQAETNKSAEADTIQPKIAEMEKSEAGEEKTNVLSRQMEELKEAVAEFSNKLRLVNREMTLTFSPDILRLYNGLIKHDVQEELSKEIAAQAQDVKGRRNFDTKSIAQQLILDRLGEPMSLKLKKFKQNVLLFTGPTGAGKTTTLAKLAGMLKFREKLDVAIINTDTYRIGAMEQIKIYSDIMDIPLVTAYNEEELKNALKSLADKDVVLIDTAGRSTREETLKAELTRLIEASGADEVFLVISVSTGYNACRDIISSYSFIENYKLIITKLDEVSAWGNVLNIANYAQKSLSYVTMGQNVPDDIRKVDIQRLAENIIGEEAAL
ncbi:MAG: flagellar biosynthesis protein FlhF [Burkholderiales bacterium]